MNIYFDKIKKYRNERGISVKGFVKLLDISRTTLWKWEKGIFQVSEETVKKIANILNVAVSDISDMPEPVKISQHSFSGVVNSWLGLTEINDIKHQNQISLVLDTIQNLNNKLNQSVLIIKALLDSMETMFYIKDSRLKYLTANASFLNNVSYPLENPVLGKDDYSFFSQEEAKTNSEEDRKVFQTGEAILREERYIPGCRKTKWGIVSKLPVFDSENKIVGVIGTFIDITERQKSEEKLKLLEHCFDSTGQIITIADDIDRQFLYVSKASFEEITGYSINEMYNTENIEKTLSKICHSQDLHKHYYNVKWPESHSFEWRLICANKTEKILKTTVSQILSSLNNKHYTIGVSIDVTNELKIHDNQIKNLLTSEFSKLSSCFLWTAEITKNDNKQILNPRAIIDRLKHFESNLSNHQYFTIFNEASRKYLFVSNNFEKITGYSLDFFYNSTNPTPVSELCHSKDIHKHSYNSDWPEVNALSWRLICKNKKIKLLKSIKTRIRIGNNVFIIALITEVDEAQNDIILPKDKEIITDIVNNFNKSEEIKENIRINYLSDEFEFITGYSKSDFTENKQSIQSIIHPDNIEILNNWLKTQNTPTMLNFKIISSDNKTINIKSSVQSKKTEDSKTFYFGKAEVVTK